MKRFIVCYGKTRLSHGSDFVILAEDMRKAFSQAKKTLLSKGFDVDNLYNFFVIDDEESMKSFKKDCYLGWDGQGDYPR